MNCPKCNATHDLGARECPACGIIFERWQPRERTVRRTEVPPPADHSPVRFFATVIFIVLFVFGGLWWSGRVRNAQKDRLKEFDAQLDRINREGMKTRQEVSKRVEEKVRTDEKQGMARMKTIARPLERKRPTPIDFNKQPARLDQKKQPATP